MLSDPIVALATPAGRSALAVVRLSGDGALAIAGRVIAGFSPDSPRTATLATFHAADGTPIDRGLYTVFPGPASSWTPSWAPAWISRCRACWLP